MPSHRIARTFRLWLVTEPSPGFPRAMISNGVKLVAEPPPLLRKRMQLAYRQHSQLLGDDR